MGLAHGEWKKQRQEGVWVDVCRMRTGRNGQTEDGWMLKGGGWHAAGIKSPIKLHGGILIYRLMSYCVTNHGQPFQ